MIVITPTVVEPILVLEETPTEPIIPEAIPFQPTIAIASATSSESNASTTVTTSVALYALSGLNVLLWIVT